MSTQQERSYMELLKKPVFASFFISQILTNLSDGLLAVAIVYSALQLGASPAELGIITFGITLTRGLFGPIGGVLGDRYERKGFLQGIEIGRSVLVGVIFVLSYFKLIDMWTLMIIGMVVSSLFAISVPSAKAIIPKLVKKDDLQLANGLIQTITWPAYFLGSGLLAVLIPLGIVDHSFSIATVFFVISSILLSALPRQVPSEEKRNTKFSGKNFVAELNNGYQALQTDRVMNARVWTYGVFTFFWRGSLQIVLPLVVLKHLNSAEWVYGALMFVNGAIELIANLVIGKKRFKTPLVFTFSCELLIGIALGIIYLSFFLPVPEIGLFVAFSLIGIGAATIDIPLLTVIQNKVSEDNVGKVISYWFTIGSIGGALGTLALGFYFEVMPLVNGILVLSLFVLLFSIASILWAARKNTYVMEHNTNDLSNQSNA